MEGVLHVGDTRYAAAALSYGKDFCSCALWREDGVRG
jgi:hypothetical protein